MSAATEPFLDIADFGEQIARISDGQLARERSGEVRVVQWNVERGYQLQRIVEQLRALEADILALQEIDVGCDRSGGVDVGREIARALGLRYYCFVREFEELRSPLRDARTQGGGFHGNAILSRYELVNVRAWKHRHQPYDWERDGMRLNEPRHGARCALTAEVRGTPLGHPLQVYCIHLEVFCGILGRVAQFCDIFADARTVWEQSGHFPQLICGDLNTMAHTIARLSPKYCRDKMRFLSFGTSEPRWWAAHVFGASGETNAYLSTIGLPEDVCRDAVNPGFRDPFDIDRDITVSNHWGLFSGKLDWMLMRGTIKAMKIAMGNHDYDASDHKYLSVDIRSE